MKCKIICLKASNISVQNTKDCIEQAKKFNIDVEIFNAIDGRESKKHFDVLNIKKKWDFKEGGTIGIDGCFLSHFYLWKECFETNIPYIILEHDGYFIKKLPDNILKKFEDVLKLDHLDPFSQYYNQQLESHKNINENIIKYYNDFSKQTHLNETGSYLRGAYSYIIKPLAAKKLINRVYEQGYLPADCQIGDEIVDIKVCVPTIARLHPMYSINKNILELSTTRDLLKQVRIKKR
jgi:GR25 family glycosyltransferase involved in LPS biosynthesis